jgi:hypothetical protein
MIPQPPAPVGGRNMTIPGFKRMDYLMVAQIQIAYHERFPLTKSGDFAVGILDGVNQSLKQAGFERATMGEIFPPSDATVAFAERIPAPLSPLTSARARD